MPQSAVLGSESEPHGHRFSISAKFLVAPGGDELDAVEQLAPQGFTDVDTILNYEAREAIVRGYAAKAGFAARVVARQ